MLNEEAENSSRKEQRAPVLRWVILALVLLAGMWFGIQALQNAKPAGKEISGSGGPAGPPPATVIVATVEEDSVQEERRVTGTLRAVQRAEIAAQESGAISVISVDAGDSVERDDVIAKLDDRRLRASLAEAKSMRTAAAAVVAEREAEATRASRDLEMNRKLLAQRAVSEREFLDAEREASVAAARLEAAKDEEAATTSVEELLEVRVADLEIKAPFSGQVVERHVDPGEWIAPGDPVVTLVSSGQIEAWMNVPERFVGAVSSEGIDFSIIADGTGVATKAISVRLVADIDPVTRLFPVVVLLDDLEGALLPGQSVHAELPVGPVEKKLAVPVDAVIETIQGASVFKVVPSDAGGMPTAERVELKVAFRRNGIAYAESDNLKVGERVVVEGNERLFPGTPLIIEEASSHLSSPPKP